MLTTRLRQAIDRTGLSKAKVAAALGITPQSVSSWLKTGRISKRSLQDLAKLAAVPAAAILDGPMPTRDLPHGVRELPAAPYSVQRPDELELLDAYRRCDDAVRAQLRAIAATLAGIHQGAKPTRARQSA